MRLFATAFVLVLIAVGLIGGIAAGKPRMIPSEEEILIQEGDELEISCRDEDGGEIKFSTQWNMVHVNQSGFHISFNESGWYTFTRPNTTKEDTGWYACAEEGIEILNDEQTIEHPETNISWIYVYVNSSRPFAIDGNDENEDELDYMDEDKDRDYGHLIDVLMVEGRKVIIPCRPTSPDLPVILEFLIGNENKLVPESTKYDPKIGFIVSENNTCSTDYAFFQCTSVCRIDRSKQLANLRLPSDYRFPAYGMTPLYAILRIEPLNLAWGIRGQDLRIECQADLPMAGGTVLLDWKIPKSSSAERVKYRNISSTEITKWNVIYRTLELKINDVKKSDTGPYRCVWEDPSTGFVKSKTTHVWVLGPGETVGRESKRVNLRQDAFLTCNTPSGMITDYVWVKIGDSENTTRAIPGSTQHDDIGYLFLYNVSRSDNGTYECRGASINGPVVERKDLIVTEVPEVKINFTIPVGADRVYLNWTVYDGNEPVQHYFIQSLKNGTQKWENRSLKISGESFSHVVEGLDRSTVYQFRISALNSIGRSLPAESKYTRTLDKDPELPIPTLLIRGMSDDSISIKWSKPTLEYRELVHYHKIEVTPSGSGNVSIIRVTDFNHHTLMNLTPGIKYSMKVAACSNYTRECSPWSAKKEAVTFDEDPRLLTTNDSKLPSTETNWIVVGVFVILFLVLAIWVAIWTKLRRRSELAARRRFIAAAVEAFKSGDRCSVDPELDMAAQAELLPYNKKWEFPRNLLKLDKIIGSGSFGTVRKAEAESICKGEKYSTVAVKMVRATHRLDHMMALQRELKILAHLGKHLNVVNMLGACTKRISYGELLVIVEFCRFGNLHDYLLRRRADFVDQVDVATEAIAGPSFRTDCVLAIDSRTNTENLDGNLATEESSRSTSSNGTSVIVDDPAASDDIVIPVQAYNYNGDFTDLDLEPIGTRDLLCWAWQVSRGMKYLSSKKVVHADLAARNILLADNNTVKICDFGLAKSLYAGDIYKKEGDGPLPVKWMPIESIGDRVFSIKSDVWSFGVVLWEFFSLAKTPYPGVPNESIYTKLVDGFRMEKPEYATEEIYRVMLSCWEAEPSNRPSFKELEDILDELLDDRIKDHYISFDAVYAEINAAELANGKKDYLTMSPSEYASGTAETTV